MRHMRKDMSDNAADSMANLQKLSKEHQKKQDFLKITRGFSREVRRDI